MIAEPDVALTDYALVVETFLFTLWMYRIRPLSSKSLQRWFLLLFASIGIAALVGGTVHGFLTDARSQAARICWLMTMILLGITALSEYGIAARLLLGPRSANLLIVLAVLGFFAYVAIVVLWNASFRIAVIDYLGGLVLLSIALFNLYLRNRPRAALVGIAGLLLTVAASVVQQAHISVDPRYFNHNALYHLLEAIALFLIYRAGRSLVNLPVAPENK
jgi:hypothetical protein